MAGDLLVVMLRMNLAHPGDPRKPVQAVAFEAAIDPCIRDPEPVIALQVSDDPDRPQMVLAAKVQDILRYFRWRLVGVIVRHRAPIRQARFAMCLIGMPPPIEAGTPNPKIPACLADIPDRLGMLKNA